MRESTTQRDVARLRAKSGQFWRPVTATGEAATARARTGTTGNCGPLIVFEQQSDTGKMLNETIGPFCPVGGRGDFVPVLARHWGRPCLGAAYRAVGDSLVRGRGLVGK